MNEAEGQKPAELQSQPAVMTAQISIKRAATGKVEDYTLTFSALPDEPTQEKEPE